jgi:hypothetical protein
MDVGWVVDGSSNPSASCSNLFRSSLPALAQEMNNISVDPLFCGSANPAQPYALDESSPCAEGNSGTCGRIGAFPVGCAVSPVPDGTPPLRPRLLGNYPNPFNPRTTIRFSLDASRPVRISIYDLGGRLVKLLIDGVRPPGEQEIEWDGTTRDGRPCPAGVYFVHLKTEGERDTGRLSLIK